MSIPADFEDLLLDIDPDAQSPIEMTLEWNTDVTRYNQRAERRQTLRNKPMMQLSFGITGGNDTLGRYDSFMYGADIDHTVVPLWPMRRRIAAQGGAYGQILTVPGVVDVRAGDWVLLWQGLRFYDVAKVQSISGSTVVLRDQVRKFVGDSFIPLVNMRIEGNYEVQAVSAEVFHADVLVHSLNFFQHDFTPYVFNTRKGLPINPWRHNYNTERPRNITRQFIIWDNEMNRPIYIDKWGGYQAESLDYKDLMFTGFDEIDKFWSWLYQIKGRAFPFYTQLNDNYFTLNQPILAGSNEIYVTDQPYSRFSLDYPQRRDMVITLKSGEVIETMIQYSEMISRFKALLVTDHVFDQRIEPEDILNTQFYLKTRMGSDSFTLQYLSPDKMMSSFSLEVVDE